MRMRRLMRDTLHEEHPLGNIATNVFVALTEQDEQPIDTRHRSVQTGDLLMER